MSSNCGLSQQRLDTKGFVNPDQTCTAKFMLSNGDVVECGCLYTQHHDEKAPPALQQQLTVLLSSTIAPHAPVIPDPLRFSRPEHSASHILKSNPEHYDVFAQVCGPETFVSNCRIQDILDSTIDPQTALRFQQTMQSELLFVDSFRGIEGGSETSLVDLNLQTFLSIMSDFHENKQCRSLKFEPEINHLTSSMSARRCFVCRTPNGYSHIVVGCEAKGVEASIRQCYSQLISVCGNSAIELKRLGLPKEDCVVLGLAMAGSNCQFCAVYLLDDNFPVFVALSPELNLFGTFNEQLQIATWALKCLNYSSLFLENLSHSNGTIQPCPVTLSRGYFLKPIRTTSKAFEEDEVSISFFNPRLNHQMRIYELLRLKLKKDYSESKHLILFPEGVVAIPGEGSQPDLKRGLVSQVVSQGFSRPSDHCPLILFPMLRGWKKTKPPLEYQESYLTQIGLVIDALNQAGIAHLDLRPANIMWTETSEREVQIKLIDFEDAVVFGHVISPPLVAHIIESRDYRYPFRDGDQRNPQYASRIHNEFFRVALTRFLLSDEVGFSQYMSEFGQEILAELSPKY